ncbi:MAG TPA: energy transducer TonB [Longimicrobium sp.]|nr:energy transducer TonB [Longimicrobium sp.]
MFAVVVGRSKCRIWSPATVAASFTVHLLLVGGAATAAAPSSVLAAAEPADCLHPGEDHARHGRGWTGRLAAMVETALCSAIAPDTARVEHTRMVALVDDGGGVDAGGCGIARQTPPVLAAAGLGRLLQHHYPTLLRHVPIEGRVEVHLVIGTDGRVRPGSDSIASATHPAFAVATRRAVGQMRFRPSTLCGRPVPARVSVPIVWTLAH